MCPGSGPEFTGTDSRQKDNLPMAGEDDLLDPSEIEALLAQANGGQAPRPSNQPRAGAGDKSTPAPQSSSTGGDLLDTNDIDALLRSQGTQGQGTQAAASGNSAGGNASHAGTHPTEQLLNQAEANLAAALAPNLFGGQVSKQDLTSASPLQLAELSRRLGAEERAELSMLQDVELDLRIELGRAELLIEEVVSLKSGSVVPLDKLAGDPVDILVNGRLIARGEVLVLNDNFCVRVAEILTPRE